MLQTAACKLFGLPAAPQEQMVVGLPIILHWYQPSYSEVVPKMPPNWNNETAVSVSSVSDFQSQKKGSSDVLTSFLVTRSLEAAVNCSRQATPKSLP